MSGTGGSGNSLAEVLSNRGTLGRGITIIQTFLVIGFGNGIGRGRLGGYRLSRSSGSWILASVVFPDTFFGSAKVFFKADFCRCEGRVAG